MCGSFCTLGRAIDEMEKLALSGLEIQPIMSDCAYSTSTRFGMAEDIRDRIRRISGRSLIHTIAEAEPLGPKNPLDALIIAPCTGKILAEIRGGDDDFYFISKRAQIQRSLHCGSRSADDDSFHVKCSFE